MSVDRITCSILRLHCMLDSFLELLSNVLNIFIQSLRWGGMYISYILHHFVGLYTCSPQEFLLCPNAWRLRKHLDEVLASVLLEVSARLL